MISIRFTHTIQEDSEVRRFLELVGGRRGNVVCCDGEAVIGATLTESDAGLVEAEFSAYRPEHVVKLEIPRGRPRRVRPYVPPETAASGDSGPSLSNQSLLEDCTPWRN